MTQALKPKPDDRVKTEEHSSEAKSTLPSDTTSRLILFLPACDMLTN